MRLALTSDLSNTIAKLLLIPRSRGALQDGILSAIADRRGYLAGAVDHAGLVVTRYHPEDQVFSSYTLEEALAWCG